MPHTEHPLGWPSVTTVLSTVAKPFLYRWYGTLGWNECERIKQEAGEFGQSVHDGIERALLGQTVEIFSERQAELVNTFVGWQRATGFTPIEIETKVEHKTLKYHGTLDSIGTFGDSNTLYVFDWKTSSRIDDMFGCQLAAYAEAYKEETGKEITVGGVVRLEKDRDKRPQLETKMFSDLPRYFKVFKACLEIYSFQHKSKRKK